VVSPKGEPCREEGLVWEEGGGIYEEGSLLEEGTIDKETNAGEQARSRPRGPFSLWGTGRGRGLP